MEGRQGKVKGKDKGQAKTGGQRQRREVPVLTLPQGHWEFACDYAAKTGNLELVRWIILEKGHKISSSNVDDALSAKHWDVCRRRRGGEEGEEDREQRRGRLTVEDCLLACRKWMSPRN